MTKKEFDEAISRLNDRYLLENMTNELYLQLRKTIETTYLKSLYKKKTLLHRSKEGKQALYNN